MAFEALPDGKGHMVDHWKMVIEKNAKIIEHRKRSVELQIQMGKALQYECLKQYKWEGPRSHDSSATRIYEPNQLAVLEDTTCDASPLGNHVVSRSEAGDKLYLSVHKTVCLCCGQKLTKTSEEVGWLTSAERMERERKVKAARKEGFQNLAEYEAWVEAEHKRRMEEA